MPLPPVQGQLASRHYPTAIGGAFRTSPYGRATFAAALLVGVSPGAALTLNSPIQHVIIVVGENHTFDNVFDGYLPRPGQTISNLRSLDIIDDDGKPGRNFSLARQTTAKGHSTGLYTLNPPRKGPYSRLPQPYATG
jgi:phospholipase C